MSKVLPSKLRAITLAINIIGQLVANTFYIWVERNCSFPFQKHGLSLPFFKFSNVPIPLLLLWNALLLAIFGISHTMLAQPGPQKALQKIFPPQAMRTLFMVNTALTVVLMMGAWQHTGITVWSLPISQQATDILSISLFSIFTAGLMAVLFKFDPIEFFGIKQIFQETGQLGRTEGTPVLFTKGIYGLVRHPMYTFATCAYLITPRMTLDRLWLTLLTLGYLYLIGIPYEEKKLIKAFGKDYVEYRKEVPAVFPFKMKKKNMKSE